MTSRTGRTTPVSSSSARPADASPGTDADRSFLRLGAALGLLGIVVQVVMDRLHPHRVAPNDSAEVFREYAGSRGWTAVHLGQFVGTLLIVLALVALARTLTGQRGVAGALALVATVTAVLVAAVFAVQMAVDGVALKAAIQAWTAAPTPVSQAATFQIAESVRWTEKGLGAFFQILNGTTLLTLGLSIVRGDRYPTWLGLVGGAAGLAFIAGGVATAHTGFSPAAGRFLLPGTILLALFLIGAIVLMWRHGNAGLRVRRDD
jgi:hypothetical protein